MDKEMRRGEKAFSQEEAIEVLNGAEYGVLSTISTDDTPYGVPVNFAYADGAIYFHCAPVGHRMENLANNNNVCFNVVDSVVLMPSTFNTQYRSVTIFGTAEVLQDVEEKKKALLAIVRKLSPEFEEGGIKYINTSVNDCHVVKINISKMTGKATRAPQE